MVRGRTLTGEERNPPAGFFSIPGGALQPICKSASKTCLPSLAWFRAREQKRKSLRRPSGWRNVACGRTIVAVNQTQKGRRLLTIEQWPPHTLDRVGMIAMGHQIRLAIAIAATAAMLLGGCAGKAAKSTQYGYGGDSDCVPLTPGRGY